MKGTGWPESDWEKPKQVNRETKKSIKKYSRRVKEVIEDYVPDWLKAKISKRVREGFKGK